MTKHLTHSELDRYRERTLPPQALLAANAHLLDCEDCYVRYGGDDQFGAAVDFLRSIKASEAEGAHPSFEHLAAYVDDALGDTERVVTATHLAACEDCEAQVRELRPLRDLLAMSTKIPATPVDASGITAFERANVRRPALFEKLRAVWRMPAYRVAAHVMAILFIVVLLAWALTRSKPPDVADRQTQPPPPTHEETQDARKATGITEDQQTQPPPVAGISTDSRRQKSSREAAPDSSRAFLALNDAGGRVILNADGRVVGLDSLSPDQRELVGRMLTNARVETPRVTWADGGGDTLLSANAGGVSFSVVGPVGKIVRDTQPTLSWTPLEGAVSYVVTIRDSQARTMATSGVISSTAWRVSQPLRRGAVYSWQVLAVRSGAEAVSPPPNAPEARFKVMEETVVEELEKAEQLRPRSHLLLGALYAGAGLLEEAERELNGLVKQNPRSRIVRRLLHDLQSRR